MNALTLTPTQIIAGVGALLVLVLVWRMASRRAKAAANAARTGARIASLAGRVVFNAVLIVVAQWIVITQRGSGWLLVAVLAVPALFASYTLTKALTVTTYEPHRRGGERR
jgi:cytochrome b561